MALFGNKRADRAEHQIQQLLAIVPAEVFQGQTIDSPFVDIPRESSRSLVPWRRREITEAVPAQSIRNTPVARQGFLGDIPRGGSTEWNQGYAQIGGATDRRTLMEQMQQLYTNCPWAYACVNAVARFSTAGGMSIEPDDESNERKETIKLSPQAQKAQDLFDFVNPGQNFRQLMRKIFIDLEIYGDSFIEVVWALGEPIALYSLPCPDMLVISDEHGDVSAYVQHTETDRRAEFAPHEVIHIKYDTPRDGLYGLGPTEASVHAITTWLFAEGLLKSVMEKGNPPNIGLIWDDELADNEVKKRSQKYRSQNMGPKNIGEPVNLPGLTGIHEFHANAIAEYMATKTQSRDEICGTYGVPPAIATIIESGSLGGGTGTSQFKNFKVNTCGPIQELVLEAFTFSILEQGFGATDFKCTFGEVDWRDDEVIENISHLRITDGRWTINRGRDEIGEPPVDGGDDAVIIQTRDVVLVKDLAAMSEAAVEKAEGPAINPLAMTVPAIGDTPAPSGSLPGKPAPATPGQPQRGDDKPPAHAKAAPTESYLDEAEFVEAFAADFAERAARARKELPKVDA